MVRLPGQHHMSARASRSWARVTPRRKAWSHAATPATRPCSRARSSAVRARSSTTRPSTSTSCSLTIGSEVVLHPRPDGVAVDLASRHVDQRVDRVGDPHPERECGGVVAEDVLADAGCRGRADAQQRPSSEGVELRPTAPARRTSPRRMRTQTPVRTSRRMSRSSSPEEAARALVIRPCSSAMEASWSRAACRHAAPWPPRSHPGSHGLWTSVRGGPCGGFAADGRAAAIAL